MFVDDPRNLFTTMLKEILDWKFRNGGHAEEKTALKVEIRVGGKSSGFGL